MKKIWSERGTRFMTHVRQRETLKDKQRPKLSGSERARRVLQRRIAQAKNLKSRPIELFAPENFSLIHNTDEMLNFLQDIADALEQGFQPALNMRDVQSLGPDAIAVLNSTIETLVEKHQIEISGSEPTNPALADTLRRSGFYEHVRPPRGVKKLADRGIVAHIQESVVDTPMIEQLIHFATTILYGQPRDHTPTYSAIGELMQNTFDHAAGALHGRERWWASVFYDQQNDVVHFTFLDNGVGILKSRSVRLLDNVRAAMSLTADTELLKQIFEGKLASVTRIRWRGKGLPGIYERVARSQLTEMTVITNRVKGDLDRGNFTTLANEFEGTLYHWEMRRQ
jgi:hypothetical protein